MLNAPATFGTDFVPSGSRRAGRRELPITGVTASLRARRCRGDAASIQCPGPPPAGRCSGLSCLTRAVLRARGASPN